MSTYIMVVRHIPGRQNTAADVLSHTSFPSIVTPVADTGPSSSLTLLAVRDWMPYYRENADFVY